VRRLLGLTALGVAVATLAVACRQYMPSNRFLQPRQGSQAGQSTADARHKFDHVKHKDRLAAAGVTCVDCHRFDQQILAANEQAAQELSARGLYPGSAPCHFCHQPGDTHFASAPTACTTCHDNIAPLMPEDHQIAWLKVHASQSRADPQRCESCHRQSFCVNCHERRDTIQEQVHDRNFRFLHSVEARANPMQCGSCHRIDYCTNCHQQGKVDIKP